MTPTWRKYAGKILRRCDLCGKFQATYRVEDPQLGSLAICLNCWKRRAAATPPPGKQSAENPSNEEPPDELDLKER